MYGYGSFGVDDRRVALQTRAAYAPVAYGPNLANVPTTQPNIPPSLGSSPTAAVSTGAYGSESMGGAVDAIGGYGTAANNGLATSLAAHAPFSLHSPVVPALLFLLVGLLGLRFIHWR